MAALHVILGTGPLARGVMRELAAREGCRIRMVNRAGRRDHVPDAVEVVACDLLDPAAVRRVAEGAAVVYQCAQPAYTEWAARFPPLQAAILEGVAAAGAKLVVGDNLYLYGPSGGAPLREDLPPTDRGTKQATRARMARELLEAHRAGSVRVAIARGSDFYGEHVTASHAGEMVFGNLLRGRAARTVGRVDLPHTLTYVGDFGKAMVILGEREEALGQAWHVPNAEPRITLRDFVGRVARAAGVEPRLSAMPRPVFEALSLFHPMLREFRELRHQFREPYVVDHSRFAAAFGDISTPVDEAIRRTVAWYRTWLRDTEGERRP